MYPWGHLRKSLLNTNTMFSPPNPRSSRFELRGSPSTLKEGELRDGGSTARAQQRHVERPQTTPTANSGWTPTLGFFKTQAWSTNVAPQPASQPPLDSFRQPIHGAPLGDVTNTRSHTTLLPTIIPSALAASSASSQSRDSIFTQQDNSPSSWSGADDRLSQIDELGYDSASTDESEQPLQVRRRESRPRIQPSPSPPPSTAVKSEPRLTESFASSPKRLVDRLPGEEPRYQVDFDWVDKCDDCKKVGVRCYTKAGTIERATSCYNCYLRHWTCSVDGVRCSESIKEGKKPQVKSPAKLNATARQESRFLSRPATTTRSGRSPKTAQQGPVVLSQTAEQAQKRRRKRKSTVLVKTSQEIDTAARPQRSGVDLLPGTEDDHLTDASSGQTSAVPEPSTDAVSAPVSSSQLCQDASTPQTQVNTQMRQEAESLEEDNNTSRSDAAPSAQTITAEAVSLSTPNPFLESWTIGLIEDIEIWIRRCQESPVASSEQLTLLALETQAEIFVNHLKERLESGHLDTENNITHFILPRITTCLEKILAKCKEALNFPAETELNEEERKSRRFVAIKASETHFTSCLRLIDMRRGQHPT